MCFVVFVYVSQVPEFRRVVPVMGEMPFVGDVFVFVLGGPVRPVFQ